MLVVDLSLVCSAEAPEEVAQIYEKSAILYRSGSVCEKTLVMKSVMNES